MQQIILGSAGFLLYFIYDINSVRKQNRLLQKFFAVGTILVVLSLFMELWFAWGQCSHRIGRMIGVGIGAMCFLALLIYTLFFALPFEQTYCEGIQVFCGLQVHIFVCGECLADGNRESIFYL